MKKTELEKIKSYTVYPSSIDNRIVKCACGFRDCKIGVNASENGLFLTDKYGNEHLMYIDDKNSKELISILEQK